MMRFKRCENLGSLGRRVQKGTEVPLKEGVAGGTSVPLGSEGNLGSPK